MDAAPDSPDRYPDRDADLVIGEANDVAHDHGLSKVKGEIEQSLLNVVIEGDRAENFVR
jgi:hypothetical protein